VQVLHPSREPDRERFSLTRAARYGVEVFELANRGDERKRFDDSYACEGVERAFAELLARERPDVVHFTHLLWGLSVRLPGLARAAGARTVVTATDLGLVCHRGQLRDWRGDSCEGPQDAGRCARCVRTPGRWDHGGLGRGARHLAVTGLALVGGAGRVVTRGDLELRREVVAAAARDVDHWIFPTHAVREPLEAVGIAPRAASLLPYGIDERAYAGPRVPAAPGEGVRFVFMSQYMPHKGLDCLLEAARRLESSLPTSVLDWRVHLHGNGSGGRGRRYAEELLAGALPHRVRDRGPFEPLDAPDVLAASDCVLVPSEWRENAPLTVLQARAAGVPVIASDVPGIREVLEPGRHGLLVPPGDPASLAAAMAAVVRGRGPEVRRDPVVSLEAHLDAIQEIHAAGCARRADAALGARAS
jgi:glycosyltransferase involved in cell wall biosynthesis